MIRTTMSLHIALLFAGLGISLSTIAAVPANAQNQNMEVIHHPNYDKNVFMPFVPAIKIKSGKILWLAGTTALPVYHDHPHKRDEIQKYMVNDLEAQTRAAMDGIKQTVVAAGGNFLVGGRCLRVCQLLGQGDDAVELIAVALESRQVHSGEIGGRDLAALDQRREHRDRFEREVFEVGRDGDSRGT